MSNIHFYKYKTQKNFFITNLRSWRMKSDNNYFVNTSEVCLSNDPKQMKNCFSLNKSDLLTIKGLYKREKRFTNFSVQWSCRERLRQTLKFRATKSKEKASCGEPGKEADSSKNPDYFREEVKVFVTVIKHIRKKWKPRVNINEDVGLEKGRNTSGAIIKRQRDVSWNSNLGKTVAALWN